MGIRSTQRHIAICSDILTTTAPDRYGTITWASSCRVWAREIIQIIFKPSHLVFPTTLQIMHDGADETWGPIERLAGRIYGYLRLDSFFLLNPFSRLNTIKISSKLLDSMNSTIFCITSDSIMAPRSSRTLFPAGGLLILIPGMLLGKCTPILVGPTSSTSLIIKFSTPTSLRYFLRFYFEKITTKENSLTNNPGDAPLSSSECGEACRPT